MIVGLSPAYRSKAVAHTLQKAFQGVVTTVFTDDGTKKFSGQRHRINPEHTMQMPERLYPSSICGIRAICGLFLLFISSVDVKVEIFFGDHLIRSVFE